MCPSAGVATLWPMTDLKPLAAASIELFNQTDYTGLRALLAPSFTYEETGTGTTAPDADAFVAALQAWRAAAPDCSGEVTRIAVDGGTTVVEVLWTGTQTGPLPTPAGPLPASGRRFEFRSTVWQDWVDGMLVHERHHLDVLTMLTQLGALPAPASA